jgi:phage gp46-like protein
MSTYSMQINPQTKDYQIVGGNAVQDTSLDTPIYIRLKVQRTKWLYAPDASYGSDFYKQTKKSSTTGANTSQIEAISALQPMVDDGRILSLRTDLVSQSRFSTAIKLTYLQSSNSADQVTIVPIG